MTTPQPKIFLVINPQAGNANQAEELAAALAVHFPAPQWHTEIYETTGEEDVTAIVKAACKNGATLVVAGGGDGTVAEVANGLINSPILLGILPLGTGNDLGRILNIPLEMEPALAVLAGEHTIIPIDALKVDERYFLSNVSVGLTPTIMQETQPADKKRFGRLAYFWTTFKQSSLFQLNRYRLTIDGRALNVRASEILISNTTLLKELPHLFGSPPELTDRQLEIYLVTASTVGHYLKLFWHLIRHPGKPAPKFVHLTAKQTVTIESLGRARLTQADGEVLGHTPVTVELIPKAIQVIMPIPQSE